jgi:hypothetical protein
MPQIMQALLHHGRFSLRTEIRGALLVMLSLKQITQQG